VAIQVAVRWVPDYFPYLWSVGNYSPLIRSTCYSSHLAVHVNCLFRSPGYSGHLDIQISLLFRPLSPSSKYDPSGFQHNCSPVTEPIWQCFPCPENSSPLIHINRASHPLHMFSSGLHALNNVARCFGISNTWSSHWQCVFYCKSQTWSGWGDTCMSQYSTLCLLTLILSLTLETGYLHLQPCSHWGHSIIVMDIL